MRSLLLGCAWALLGCGSTARDTPTLAAGGTTSGAGAMAVGESGQGQAVGGGLSAGSGAGEGSNNLPPAGTSTAGGAPPHGAPSDGGETSGIAAGTRFCQSPPECRDLECIPYRPHGPLVCSRACESDRDCRLGDVCFSDTGGGQPLCLRPCGSAEHCAFGFDCVRYEAITLCLPAALEVEP